MADKELTGLDPTITPAATDIFGVRQSGDSEDKRQTRQQVHNLQSGEHLILATVDEQATPTFAFGDGDSGFFEGADDNLRVAIGGTQVLFINNVSLESAVSGSWGLNHSQPASSTVPSIRPDKNDGDTGIGHAFTDQLSLIAGGIELLRLQESTVDQVIIGPAGVIGSAALPSLAWGDGDSGIFEFADDNLGLVIAGSQRFFWAGNTYAGQSINAGALFNEDATATNPTLIPNKANTGTGIGQNAADQVSIIAGGVEMMRLVEIVTVADRQIIIHPSGVIGAAATPALAFGDGDTGWFELSDDELTLSIGGTEQMVSDVDGKLFINTLTGTGAQGSNIVSATPDKIAIYAARSVTNGVDGGAIEIWGGYAAGNAPAVGGDVSIWAGNGGGSQANGGAISLFGGDAEGVGGAALLRGGNCSSSGRGGTVSIVGGESSSSFVGGDILITAGESTVAFTTPGGEVIITGGLSGTQDTAVGGAVTIAGGPSAATNGDGGDINLTVGAATGSGAAGTIGITGQMIFPQINAPTSPAISFGDGDTGIYEGADDQMRFAAGGSAIAEVATTGVLSSFGTSWKLIHEGPTATNPVIVPAQGDQDTGIGGIVGADTLSLISGGVAGLQLPELNSNVIQAPDAQIGLTAFATGGQGSATQVNSSYAQFSTVATLADSGRLPPVFKIGSIITVKNDGAADMDLFPSSGDDLGAGTDTAVSIVSGTAAKFLATVADSTWTQIGSSVAV